MTDDKVGPSRVAIAQGLNEHQQRLAAALELSRSVNHPPKLSTIPAVMVNWDFATGVLTIAHSFASELEVHICYLRISDIQITFGQMMDVAAQTKLASDKYLKAVGDVMGAVRPSPKLL